jgi:AAHS family 4-hydroxybenzoate transporter-like MFS transporter
LTLTLAAARSIDIGQHLDGGPFTGVQRGIVLLAALSIVMDGFDGQLIGYALPVILKEWSLSKADFAPVVAAGLIGMGIGSASAGLFADRFGRRWSASPAASLASRFCASSRASALAGRCRVRRR